MFTKYRIISNGYWDFLQYEKEKSYFFGLIKRKKWYYIWRPYYHRTYGRTLDSTGSNCYVNSLKENLIGFVNQWKCINHYFAWAEVEQRRLEEIVRKQNNKIEEKRNKIEYLN